MSGGRPGVRPRAAGRRLALLVGLSLPLGGCGVELAVLGAAASAASTGSAVFKRGKLNASWMARFERVVAAAELATHDLGLTLLSSAGDSERGRWTVTAENDEQEKFIVRVTRKAPRLTEFQVDVGWFASEPTARLLLRRMAVAIDLEETRTGVDS